MDHMNPNVAKEIKKERNQPSVNVKVECAQFADESVDQIIKSESTIKIEQETTTGLSTENLLIENKLKNNDYTDREPQRCTNKKNKKFTCAVCDRTYRKKHSLKEHIQKFHDVPVKYICNYCEKDYFSKNSLRKHILVVHLKATVSKCDFCGKVFCDGKTRDHHVKNACPKNVGRRKPSKKKCVVSCELCHKVFGEERSKNRHLKYACIMNDARVKRPLGSLESHTDSICHLCNKQFYDKKTKNRHIESACPMNTMKPTFNKYKPEAVCEFCNKSFASTFIRNNHSQHVCPMNKNRTKKLTYSEVKCNLCNKVLCNNRSLERHIKYSCPNNPNKLKLEAKCNFCDKFFKEDYVHEHAKFHCIKNKDNNIEKSTTYKCDTCTKVFYNIRDMVTHSKTSCAILGM